MKKLLLVSLLLVIVGCSNKYSKLETINVIIPNEVSYESPEEVAENVKEECFDLELNLSKFMYLHGRDLNINYMRRSSINIKEKGLVFDIKITNVYSGRGMYHNKNMMLKGALYQDGKLMSEFQGSRGSNGGMFSLIRSSCSVLDSTASALAKDASLWLRKSVK